MKTKINQITISKLSFKKYKCKRCGYIKEQHTNHFGETHSLGRYNTCKKCPPFAKYPEFGGITMWECLEKE